MNWESERDVRKLRGTMGGKKEKERRNESARNSAECIYLCVFSIDTENVSVAHKPNEPNQKMAMKRDRSKRKRYDERLSRKSTQ